MPFVPAATVADADEAVRAAAAIGYPVALKALGLLHKSDAGGVVLGLAGRGRCCAPRSPDVVARLRPPALSVERMAPLADGVELIAGARWEPRLGPLVHGRPRRRPRRDAARRARRARARRRGRRRGAAALAPRPPLLLGARGGTVLDVRACAEAVAALSRVAAAHPELAELEVNPLLALPEGALALDARAV